MGGCGYSEKGNCCMHIFWRGSVISRSKAWRYGNFFVFLLSFFLLFFPFPNVFCEWGDRIGVHCGTEQEWEQRQCVDLWWFQWYDWWEWEFTAQSIEHCFAFRCLGFLFFSNYHHLSTYHQSVAFGVFPLFLDLCSPFSYLVHTTWPLFVIISLHHFLISFLRVIICVHCIPNGLSCYVHNDTSIVLACYTIQFVQRL